MRYPHFNCARQFFYAHCSSGQRTKINCYANRKILNQNLCKYEQIENLYQKMCK